jgi:hypothetical protein
MPSRFITVSTTFVSELSADHDAVRGDAGQLRPCAAGFAGFEPWRR